jgi:hypothetical protein
MKMEGERLRMEDEIFPKKEGQFHKNSDFTQQYKNNTIPLNCIGGTVVVVVVVADAIILSRLV